MGAAAEAPDAHAGGTAGGDPVDAVFDDQAVRRRGAERGGGVQKQIGRRLGMGDVLRRMDARNWPLSRCCLIEPDTR